MSSNTKSQYITIPSGTSEPVYFDVARFGRIMIQIRSEASVTLNVSGAFMPEGSVEKDPTYAFPITPEEVFKGTVQTKGGTTINSQVLLVDMPMRTLILTPSAETPNNVFINLYMDRFDLHGVD